LLSKSLDKTARKLGLGRPLCGTLVDKLHQHFVPKVPSPWWTTSKNEVNNQGPKPVTIDIGHLYHGIGSPNRHLVRKLGLSYCVFEHEHSHHRRADAINPILPMAPLLPSTNDQQRRRSDIDINIYSMIDDATAQHNVLINGRGSP